MPSLNWFNLNRVDGGAIVLWQFKPTFGLVILEGLAIRRGHYSSCFRHSFASALAHLQTPVEDCLTRKFSIPLVFLVQQLHQTIKHFDR